MKWILTQSIFQEYTSTSRFFVFFMCCVRACVCVFSPDCFYFICKFRLISLLQQGARGRGEEQSHNFLITAPSPVKNTAAAAHR